MNEKVEQENQTSIPAPKNSKKAKMMDGAAARHIVPFALWIGIMLIAQMMHLTESSNSEEISSLNLISDATLYAIRTVICIAVLFICKPWQYYESLKKKNILPAILVGLITFVLWVFPETTLFKSIAPSISTLYETWCVMPFGELREPITSTPYAPSVCGIPLFIARFLGSAIVISIIEEFFWRGYALRTARTPDFLDIKISELHLPSFLFVAALFAVEHTEYVAGFITALIYGLFYIKKQDIWAVSIAHITTNAALGIYVFLSKQYFFW